MNPIELTDLDREIWQSELDSFVPARVFDAHTHVYRREFDRSPGGERAPRSMDEWPAADLPLLRGVDEVLLPGREVHYLTFGYPFPVCDWDELNGHAAATVAADPASAALMVVTPAMSPEFVHDAAVRHGFLGLKPYRWYAATGDAVECRITDMLPEPIIEAADDLGLIVTLHLGKRLAAADPDNLHDLQRLARCYPGVRWVLAHCARSFAPWVLEAAWPALAELPTVFVDTSAVCESDVFAILLRRFDRTRILYGSDNVPAGVARGKYITFGRAWAFVGERTPGLDLSHCDPRATFVCYESLRALRRAALALDVPEAEIEDIFWNNAAELVERVRGGVAKR